MQAESAVAHIPGRAVAGGRRTIVVRALRETAPVAVGLIPFAMVLGVTMREAGFDVATGVLGSFLVWAGSAQLAAVALLDAGSGVIAVLVTVVVINARFLLYGGDLEPKFRDQPRWFRWFAPHFLVDQNYVLASDVDLQSRRDFRTYWMAVAGIIGCVWLPTIGLTMQFGAVLPSDLPLDFAPIAVFVGLLVPRLKDSAARRAALSAALGAGAALVAAPAAALLIGVGTSISLEMMKGKQT